MRKWEDWEMGCDAEAQVIGWSKRTMARITWMPVQGRYLESNSNELMWSRGRSDLDGILTIARGVSESLEVAWRSSDVQQPGLV